MKLIKVEYIEESSKAIFFNVEFTLVVDVGSFWRRKCEVRTEIKRAFLEKWNNPLGIYANNFKWADNTGSSNFDDAIVQEMILKYEQRKDK